MKMVKQLTEQDFLKRLRELFKISQIYYPGNGYDEILERSFELEEIVYLDEDMPRKPRSKARYIRGDYGKAPFRDDFFDALFYKDNDSNLPETIEMLRTLRRGGIVIYRAVDCPEHIGIRSFGEIPGLTRVNPPFSNKEYTVFQKS